MYEQQNLIESINHNHNPAITDILTQKITRAQEGSMTWNEATEYCESQNAYLAEVLTYETQTFLEFHGTSLPATNWWVGATDQTTVSTIVFPIS